MTTLTVTQYRYLVVISQLSKTLKEVKSIDVAIELGVARATTSRMINYLVNEGWLIRNRRALTLTSKALQLLEEKNAHYDDLVNFFSQMNLDSFELKESISALIEHTSSSTLQKICAYLKAMDK